MRPMQFRGLKYLKGWVDPFTGEKIVEFWRVDVLSTLKENIDTEIFQVDLRVTLD